jgi:hypothetical protein
MAYREFVLQMLKETDGRDHAKRGRSDEDDDDVQIVAGPSKRQKPITPS